MCVKQDIHIKTLENTNKITNTNINKQTTYFLKNPVLLVLLKTGKTSKHFRLMAFEDKSIYLLLHTFSYVPSSNIFSSPLVLELEIEFSLSSDHHHPLITCSRVH